LTAFAGMVRRHRPTRLDAAMASLVRIVLADGWSAQAAAHDLRTHADVDPGLLRRARVRVARAALDRPSRVSYRAAATLDQALADIEATGSSHPGAGTRRRSAGRRASHSGTGRRRS